MVQGLRRLFDRLRFRSLTPDELTRRVDGTDGLTAAHFDPHLESRGEGGGGIPPHYVKSYDEGRPKK